MWFVLANDPAFPRRHVVQAHTIDHQADVWLPGVLVADALDELRTILPDGLTRRGRAPFHPPDVVASWD